MTLALRPPAEAKLPSPPERAPKEGTFAGFASFKNRAEGRPLHRQPVGGRLDRCGAGRPFSQAEGFQRRHRLRRHPQDHEIRAFGKPASCCRSAAPGRIRSRSRSCRRNRQRDTLPELPACYCFRCDIPSDRKSAGTGGTALPPVAFHISPTPDLRALKARREHAWSATMHRLAGLFAAFVDPVRIGPLARACAGQEPHRVRRGLDEERARRRRCRLYRQDRRQGRRQLCREFGAGQADRTGRAGGYFRLRRHRLDGLCDQQEDHQRTDAGSICSATASC